MDNKLYRSQNDKVVAGVCGGLGHYFNIDPVLVRLLFVLLAVGPGVGVLLYLVLWLVLPYSGADEVEMSDRVHANAGEIGERARAFGQDVRQSFGGPGAQGGLIAGMVLIGLGFVFLLDNLHIGWLRWLNFDLMWPLLLIALGGAIIVRRNNGLAGTRVTDAGSIGMDAPAVADSGAERSVQ